MLLRAKSAVAGLCRDTTTVLSGNISEQTNLKPVSFFLYRVNPANWFSEFSKISITLEEFAPAKQVQEAGNSKHS